MDLKLYARVLWRFRVIVLVGLLFAIVLSVLTVANVTLKGGRPILAYRQSDTWASSGTIFVTQKGFPLGRSIFTTVIPVGSSNGTPNYVPALSDPTRFTSYATLYANIATSDDVSRLMVRQGGPLRGSVSATPSTLPNNPSIGLPFITITGLSDSADGAFEAATRGTRAFITYVKQQQDAAAVPQDQRVLLKVLNHPAGAVKTAARSKTRPVIVFLAVMMGVLGLAFVLENLRPRLRSLEAQDPVQRPTAASRRSA